nr:substrate-binding domain-containing protein [Bradyrhizobium vignae]
MGSFTRAEIARADVLQSSEMIGHGSRAELVHAGQADCGIATRAAARSAGLDFVPLVWENFDLAMRQRSYFRPAMQALLRFLNERRLRQRAEELTGYDPSPARLIRFAA